MQKSEMAVCLGYLYSRYPTKMQARDATETFYQAFKDYNSNVFTWILDQYHGEYFPTVEEIAELIKDQKRIQEDILNDPKMIELIAAIIEDMFRPSETTSVNAHDAVEDRC